MQQTTNVGLNQWEKDDRIQMEDFNSDNAKIDAAIRSLTQSGVKIVFGSYTGTDAYGEKNPNSLTFDFTPKIIFFCSQYGRGVFPYLWGNDTIEVVSGGVLTPATVSINGNTITWYSTVSSDAQINAPDLQRYVAIG